MVLISFSRSISNLAVFLDLAERGGGLKDRMGCGSEG
jgi:hypothetical protein